MKRPKESHFLSQENPGFSMRFANGWTISVQWHAFAYCERRNFDASSINDKNPASSITAEIAAWDSEGNWYDFGGDQVLGYQSPDEVTEWIYKIKSMI